jgi:hypothetical protein
LYQEKHQKVIPTYDVTHHIALMLKQELETEGKYQEFCQKCYQCRQEIQQTEMLFLRPPAARSKARYFNLEPLIKWGNKIKIYEETSDFSLINESYIIDQETLYELVFKLNAKQLECLTKLSTKTDQNLAEIKSDLEQKCGKIIKKKEREIILKVASRGGRRFREKFAWVKEYYDDLIKWNQMLEMARLIENKLKTEGLHQKSLAEFEQMLPPSSIPSYLLNFYEKNRQYLEEQTADIKGNQVLLATSDILESLFGKYKLFTKRCSLPELGRMVLTIPLATVELTNDLIKEALESISEFDLKAWQKEVFGMSTLSKIKTAFSSSSLT